MANLEDLLEKTSRTFALSIPQLPEPTRRQVTIAYLLFRIADTFEDGASWPPHRRLHALQEFAQLLGRPSTTHAQSLARRWHADPPVPHAGYLELLDETPFVLATFRALDPAARRIIRSHLLRTVEGMALFVSRGGEIGTLQVSSLEDLRAYCYAVAGLVGEMLTGLFLVGCVDLSPVADELRSRAREFGEGLQLVNILKDSATDLAEGRSYLPPGLDRSRVFALARRDLSRAAEYVAALQRISAPRGLVCFCALPVLLARASLRRIEAQGPGAKLTRPEVYALVELMNRAVEADLPAVAPDGT